MSNNLFKIETNYNEEQMENLKKEVYGMKIMTVYQ